MFCKTMESNIKWKIEQMLKSKWEFLLFLKILPSFWLWWPVFVWEKLSQNHVYSFVASVLLLSTFWKHLGKVNSESNYSKTFLNDVGFRLLNTLMSRFLYFMFHNGSNRRREVGSGVFFLILLALWRSRMWMQWWMNGFWRWSLVRQKAQKSQISTIVFVQKRLQFPEF